MHVSSINKDLSILSQEYIDIKKDLKGGIESFGKTTTKEIQDKRLSELSHKLMALKSNFENSDTSKLDKKFISTVKTELDDFESKIDKLKTRLGEIPVKFQATDVSNKNVVSKIYESIVEGFVNACNMKVRSYCFMGASQRKQLEKLPGVIEDKRSKLEASEKKLEAVKKKISELENQAKAPLSKSELKRTNTIINANYQQKEALKTEVKQLKASIDKLQSKLDSDIKNNKRGDEIRKHFSVLGGSRVEITTADNVKLDGVYLDAQAFRKTLKDSGCELVTFSLQTGQEALPVRQVQAISMSAAGYDAKGKEVLKALEKLKGLSGDPTADHPVLGVGWSVVKDGSNVLLVRTEELPDHKDRDHALFAFDKADKTWNLKSDSVSSQQRQSKPMDDAGPAKGTVIFSSGATGVYEMHKDEALAFLFKNMNVVLFNFRGYGKSEGEPTEKGLKLDMEAAYQLAKAKSGHADKQLLFKALCMSGGPAAYVAAKHPETNLFLDQTYSDFKSYVYGAVKTQAENILGVDESETQSLLNMLRSGLADIAARVVSSITPDFNTAKALAANSGQKALFFTLDDDMMDITEVQRNMESVAKAGKMEFLSVFPAPGEHGDDMFAIHSSPADMRGNDATLQVIAQLKEERADRKSAREDLLGELATAKEELQRVQKDIKVAMKARNLPESKAKRNESKQISKNIEKLNSSIKKADKNIRSLGKKIDAESDYMKAVHGENVFKKEMIGRNQMDHFLAKANLADDILKSDTTLRQSGDSVMVRTQREANQYINTLERLKAFHQNNFKQSFEGEPQLTIQHGQLVFEITTGAQKNNIILDKKALQIHLSMAEELSEFLSLKQELERSQLGKPPLSQNVRDLDPMAIEEQESKTPQKLNPEATNIIKDIHTAGKAIELAMNRFYDACDANFDKIEELALKLIDSSPALCDVFRNSVDEYLDMEDSGKTYSHLETIRDALEELRINNANVKTQLDALSDIQTNLLLTLDADPRLTEAEKKELYTAIKSNYENLIEDLASEYESTKDLVEQTLQQLPPDIAKKVQEARV